MSAPENGGHARAGLKSAYVVGKNNQVCWDFA